MNERGLIAKQAGTVLVGQVAVMAFGVTDTVVAGRFAQEALAALSVGSAIYISVYVTLMGLLQALLPILSEMHGANTHSAIGRALRQGLYLCAVCTLAGIWALTHPGWVFEWTDVPPAMQDVVRHYLSTLAWALAPALLFRMFSTLNQSLGQPQWVTWIQVAGLALKIPLSIGLTFGWGGLAAQGVNGCAQATLVVNVLMFVLALALLRRQPFYKPYRIWQTMERPHWPSLLEMLKIGVPNAISITVEVTSYTLMALFIARLGNTASASHQIVANLGALLYMVPLSLAIATSARVSYWVGAQNFAHAQAAMRQGFALLLGVCSLLLLGIALGREFIAHLYTRDAAVAELASELMAWLTWYQAVDAFQVMCFFLLRCFRITLAPLVVYTLLLWGVGLTGGYVLAYQGVLSWGPLQSPEAFWMTSSLALTGVALGLGLLLHFAVQARAQR
jgi:MATE family multidrug resistance protein